MTNDLVSIVMPMYNSACYVHEAIGSVLQQDYPHFELVIVDDGSTDGGYEIVQRSSDPRIRLIRTENRGASAARNRGIDESQGKYVTFLDSDDLLLSMSLSSRLTALLRTDAEVAFSRNVAAVDFSSEIGSIAPSTAYFESRPWRFWAAKDVIDMLVDGTFFLPPWSIIIDRRLLQRIGGFDPLIKIYVDVEFTSRLLLATQKLVETFAPFYVYRRRRDSLSVINSRRKAAESLRTLRQTHRNLAPYLVGREDKVAQLLFTYCVQAYPYWTNEHRHAMAEAHRRRGGNPFDLSCIGGQKAKLVARLLGWRAGRLANFASNYLKYNLFTSLRI